MPPGIPVATVAINGAKNAGILAASILSVKDPEIEAYLWSFKDNLNTMVHDKIGKLDELGYKEYVKEMKRK
jgi:5-(carboxyamino)imidazole ribonucleotide mutase